MLVILLDLMALTALTVLIAEYRDDDSIVLWRVLLVVNLILLVVNVVALCT